MDREQGIIDLIDKLANNSLDYLKKSTKNIDWSMTIEYIRWDCLIKVRGNYLSYYSEVWSPSLDLTRAISDDNYIPSSLEHFGEYVLHRTIDELSKQLFTVTNGC